MKHPAQKPDIRVGGLTPLSSTDYPGELSAVIFCQGCPWNCRYCHNPQLLPARSKSELNWQQVVDFLQHRRGLLDAVVFSGGEPTLQSGLGEALTQARRMGFKTGLHTAGIYPERLKTLLGQLNWVGLDIKAAESAYLAVTGVKGSGESAWRSAEILVSAKLPHEIRIPIEPERMTAQAISRICDRLTAMGCDNIVLQPVRHLPEPGHHHAHPLPADWSQYKQLADSAPQVSFRGENTKADMG